MEFDSEITEEVMMNQFGLSNKKILLFGGARVLDQAIIKGINEHGASLVEFEEHEITLIEQQVKEIVKNHGVFDGVMFSIVHSDFRPLQFVKPDNVNEIMNDNYALFVELMRALKKHKGLAKGASVVAMSSISSVRAMKAKMAFCASKAALDAAVRCLAVELADQGIRVNSILKGGTEADLTKANVQDMLAVRGESAEESNRQPLGLCTAEEVANLVVFLLSDAVRTITGTSIVIDGGYLA